MTEKIHVDTANVHNLSGVSVTVPRDALVVFTGVSGSGKSSLAFDTIFAEGQRRYVESLNAYARQFIGQFEKPDVAGIDGLSPAIAIDQKSTSKSPRSTVGTITEINDFLRVLYARIGVAHDPETGESLAASSMIQIVETVLQLPVESRLQVLAPIVRGRKGEYNALFHQLRKEGYTRVRVDGEVVNLDEIPDDYRLQKTKKHDVEAVIDRVVLKQNDSIRHRLTEAIKTALKKSDGFVIVELLERGEDGEGYKTTQEYFFSEHLANAETGASFEEMTPRLFSFNSPYGACPTCEGLGLQSDLSPALVVSAPDKSLLDGAVPPLQKLTGKYTKAYVTQLGSLYDLPVDEPYASWTEEQKAFFLFGTPMTSKTKSKKSSKSDSDEAPAKPKRRGRKAEDEAEAWFDFLQDFDGMISILRRRYATGNETSRQYLEGFMHAEPCHECQGKRLKPFSLAVTFGGKSIYEVGELSIAEAYQWIRSLPDQLDERERRIGQQALLEVETRLKFLLDVGLDYLTLNRRSSTLSGGEAQRIRLATQIGSTLSGVLYVLDEPSIGLHPHNNRQLIQTLKALRDHGNSLIVVEHDEDTIRAADWVVDIGPGAGIHGGSIVASGPPAELMNQGSPVLKESSTFQFLTGQSTIAVPKAFRKGNGEALTMVNAHRHNLQNLAVNFPIGCLIGVTGMSGSGKSTLVFDLLYNALKFHFRKHAVRPEGYDDLTGLEHLDKFIDIDQSPIGRTSRSNPATYTGMFDRIRKLFANTEVAKMRGYGPGRFSFNVSGGRCELCQGDGTVSIEMNFLPDAVITCEQCHGRRFNRETLEVTYAGRNIAEVLAMSVEEAREFFSSQNGIRQYLDVLYDVGLGYIQLGQSATTLSGGEAQRIKLATELSKRSTGRTLYLMDEPTVGLHWKDLDQLLKLLHRLVDQGNTIIIIEHNLDLIKTCDHVIDLGPEGGARGGEIVDTGTPKELAKRGLGLTGEYLKPFFGL